MVSAFVATAALGLLFGYGQAGQLDAKLRESANTSWPFLEGRWRRFGWTLFAVITTLVFVAVAARLGVRVQLFLSAVWGGGAGFLVGLGMSLWLWLRRKAQRSGSTIS